MRARLRPDALAFTLLLGGISALAPLAIDMALPALPRIGDALAASPAATGQVLSLYLLGFGAAQLVLGPLSDAVGRRPVLLGGLALFTAAGIGCAWAPGIAWLNAFRLLAGIGGGAGPVLAFAIVRDSFSGQAARAKLSYVTTALSLAPIVAPTLGALLLHFADWRAIFAVIAFGGLALLATVQLRLGETHRAGAARRGVLAAYATVLRHRRARAFLLANAASFACMFAYIAGSPLVLMGALGVGATQYGLLFALTAAGLSAGAFLNGRLAARGVAARRPMLAGLWLQAGAAAVVLALLLLHRAALPLLIPALVTGTFCRGLIGPNATHGAMEPMAGMAGVVAALVGCLQMAAGAASSSLVALLYPAAGPAAMGAVMLAFGAASLLMGSLAIGRYAAAEHGRA